MRVSDVFMSIQPSALGLPSHGANLNIALRSHHYSNSIRQSFIAFNRGGLGQLYRNIAHLSRPVPAVAHQLGA